LVLLSDRNRNIQWGFLRRKGIQEIKKAGLETGLLDEKPLFWIPVFVGMTENRMRNSLLRQINFHCFVDAHIQAGKADDALLRVVGNLPALSVHIQSACRADGHAGGTARASLLEVLDLLREGFDGDSQLLQVIEGERELGFLTAQLHHHPALLSRVNAGPKDVDDQVIVFDESIRDRLFYVAWRK